MDTLTNNIISQLCAVDEKLLLYVNGLHTPLLDNIMYTVSAPATWIPLYLIAAFFILRQQGRWHGLLCLLMVGAAVSVSDYTCASLLRPAIGRLRPSCTDNPLAAVVHIVNGHRGGRYGFPSCHAANTAAIAVYISLCFRRRAVTLAALSWSALISLSRIYLGVHYPGDVIGGAVVGSFSAFAFMRLYVMAVSRRWRVTLGSTVSDGNRTIWKGGWLKLNLMRNGSSGI